MKEITKFEVGKRYAFGFICDHELVVPCVVLKRTAQTVTIKINDREVKTCRIIGQLTEWNGAETIYPEGRYSMAPTLDAREVA